MDARGHLKKIVFHKLENQKKINFMIWFLKKMVDLKGDKQHLRKLIYNTSDKNYLLRWAVFSSVKQPEKIIFEVPEDIIKQHFKEIFMA